MPEWQPSRPLSNLPQAPKALDQVEAPGHVPSIEADRAAVDTPEVHREIQSRNSYRVIKHKIISFTPDPTTTSSRSVRLANQRCCSGIRFLPV
jgi:hypothetical protein